MSLPLSQREASSKVSEGKNSLGGKRLILLMTQGEREGTREFFSRQRETRRQKESMLNRSWLSSFTASLCNFLFAPQGNHRQTRQTVCEGRNRHVFSMQTHLHVWLPLVSRFFIQSFIHMPLCLSCYWYLTEYLSLLKLVQLSLRVIHCLTSILC